MAHILTSERHDKTTGPTAFERYRAYLASVRSSMPPNALALATSDWYFDGRDHRSPHDARLDSARIEEARDHVIDQPQVSITVHLLGAYQDGRCEFIYTDVRRYRIELTSDGATSQRGHRDWRYDEFRLGPDGLVEHEIEWWGVAPTGNWLIVAADVAYRWLPTDSALS